jgi:hypothetical protein
MQEKNQASCSKKKNQTGSRSLYDKCAHVGKERVYCLLLYGAQYY